MNNQIKEDMKSILDNRPELVKEVNKIPHTLLKVTFKAINIHHEKASSTGLPVRKLLPISSPKNCMYHSTPAKAQNIRLFTHTLPLA